MQAAEMQMKTENSVEAASAILRTLRHAVPVLLALLIALLAAAPVLADETDEAITDTENRLRRTDGRPPGRLHRRRRAAGSRRARQRAEIWQIKCSALPCTASRGLRSIPMTPKAPFPPRLRPRPQSRRLSSSTPPRGGCQVVCKGHSAVFGRCAVGIFMSFACRAPHAPPSCAFGPCLSPYA